MSKEHSRGVNASGLFHVKSVDGVVPLHFRVFTGRFHASGPVGVHFVSTKQDADAEDGDYKNVATTN